ncbi:MAG: CRISPR-associated ring nuclease Csm6 [Nitrospirota bacterium]
MKKTGCREVFVFIAGSTPQVITETIYALAVQDPAIHPHELYIITTRKGRGIVEHALIGKGILRRLAAEYRLPSLALNNPSFIVPADRAGNPLDDIRDSEENEIMGDLITSFIRDKAQDPSIRLHCSLAGGRKTMAFYLGAALQLFGRPWDKLYHVLVTPEFESNPDFFYKPKEPATIECNGKMLSTKDANIVLAELPFIRLRDKLTLESAHFRQLVEEGQKEIDIAAVQPELRVSLAKRTVYIGQKAVTLQPLHLMIYVAYLKCKLYRCKYPERPYCRDCTECFPSLLDLATKPALEEMAKDYRVIAPSKVNDLLHKYKEGMSVDSIRQAVSKIKKCISEQLDNETLASYYSITTSLRAYANSRHGVRAEKGKIRISGDDERAFGKIDIL